MCLYGGMLQLIETSTLPSMPLWRHAPAPPRPAPSLVCHYGGMIQLFQDQSYLVCHYRGTIQLVKTSPTVPVPGMPLCRRDPARQDHPYLVCHYGGMIQLAGHHGQLLANSPPSNFLILKHKRTNVYTSFNLSLLTASIPVLIFIRTNQGTLNFCDFFLFQKVPYGT